MFEFRLAPILNARKARESACERDLAIAAMAERTAAERRRAAQEELAAARQRWPLDAGWLACDLRDIEIHLRDLERRVHVAAQNEVRVAAQNASIRERYRTAMAERAALERLETRERAAYELRRERAEEAEREEYSPLVMKRCA